MRTRLNMFMLGRNGVDFLNKHLFRIAAIIAGLNLLFLGRIGSVPFLIAGYALFRTLSRNLPMRQAEDMVAREKYDRAKEKISGALHRAKQSRDFRFFLLSRLQQLSARAARQGPHSGHLPPLRAPIRPEELKNQRSFIWRYIP